MLLVREVSNGQIHYCQTTNHSYNIIICSFQEILISLEGLSFPPEWKALLSAAGIPRETMEDPTSARNIISLVNQSMTMNQRELDQMALESHNQLMNAMDITEEDVEETGDHQEGSQTDVLDSVEDVSNMPPIGMEDSGYDDDPILTKLSARGTSRQAQSDRSEHIHEAGHQGIPQPPPPPIIAPSSANPTPDSLMAQAQVLRKTRQHGRDHSPDGDVPEFQLDAGVLTNQREKLKTTTKGPHPSQLANLETASKTRLISIADLLKKVGNL